MKSPGSQFCARPTWFCWICLRRFVAAISHGFPNCGPNSFDYGMPKLTGSLRGERTTFYESNACDRYVDYRCGLALCSAKSYHKYPMARRCSTRVRPASWASTSKASPFGSSKPWSKSFLRRRYVPSSFLIY